jgi:hypothetical protein
VIYSLGYCSDTVYVRVNPIPAITASETSGCSGDNLAAMSANVPSGAWSMITGIGTTVDNSSGVVTLGTNTTTMSDMDSVVYTANGCADTVSVTVYPTPDITATETSACSEVELEAMTVTISGGSWSAFSGIGTSVDQNGTVTLGDNMGTTSDQDTIVYTANGCADTVYVTVTLLAEITATDTAGCTGSLLTAMSADPSGGSWSALSTVGTMISDAGVVTLGTNSTATAVKDTIVYEANGCRDTITVTVFPDVQITASDTAGCSGASLTAMTASAPGGLWSVVSNIGTTVSAGLVILGANTASTGNTDTVMYSLNGCADSVVVTTLARPAASAGPELPCAAPSLTFDETGGDGTAWSWSGPGAFSSADQSPTVAPALAGTYTVTVTNASGCTSTDSLQVKPLPVVNAINGGPYCKGQIGHIYEIGGEGVSWQWTFPSGFASSKKYAAISPVTSGEYIVVVTGSNGCTNTGMTTICASAPTAVCREEVELQLDPASGEVLLTPDLLDGGSTPGACLGLSALSVSSTLLTCAESGANQVVLTVTDSLGCSSSCESTVLVLEPEQAPEGGFCPCESDTLYLDGVLSAKAFRASDYIESRAEIRSDVQVSLRAGQQIRLLPGFAALPGSSFSARIADCPDAFPPAEETTGPQTELPPLEVSWLSGASASAPSTPQSRVWPNPFADQTLLEINLPEETTVTVSLQHIHGGEIQTLLSAEPCAAGIYRQALQLSHLPAGMYLLTVRTATTQQTHQITQIK